MKKSVRGLFIGVLTVLFAQAAFSATYTVTKTADTNDGVCDTDCSLREAIAAANATPDADVINFSSLFYGAPQLISLSNPNTDFIITNNGRLDIVGPGPRKLQVNGGAFSRVFTANTGANVYISGIRVSGGAGSSTVSSGRGGGVYNNGATLTLSGMEISGNQTTNGGGLSTAGNGTTNVYNTVFFSNTTTTGSGGAFQNFSGSTTNIFNCSFYSNQSNSTTTGGGAIQANGIVTISNSTIVGNNANGGAAGGIYFNGTLLILNNVTIAGNNAALQSGGLHRTGVAPVNIRNSIFAFNTGAASPDVSGIVDSRGNNIIRTVGTSTGWVGSDLQNTDPILSAAGNFGGTGYSMLPLVGSPAINAGDGCVLTATCATGNPINSISYDQRGAARPSGGSVDIGAAEVAPFTAALPNAVVSSAYDQQLFLNSTGYTTVFGGTQAPGITFTNIGSNVTVTGPGTSVGNFAPTMTIAALPTQTATVNYSLAVLSAAGGISISGRVRPSGLRGGRTFVTITDVHGFTRGVPASTLGYYSFTGLSDGGFYVITAESKGGAFLPRVFVPNGNIVDGDLFGAS